MTLGGFVAFAINVSAGMPLAVAFLGAIAAVAALGLVLEFTIWAPMRRRGRDHAAAAAVDRAGVRDTQPDPVRGGGDRGLDVDHSSRGTFGDVTISAIQVTVIATAGVVLLLVATMLRVTLVGKTMRALSDSFDLAEVSGVNTRRVVIYTWLLAGSLAGLAGVLAAIYTTLTPNTGWFLLLPIFAAVVLGDRQRVRGAPGRHHARPGAGVVDDVDPADLQGGHRLPGADPGADRPAPGHLRPGAHRLGDADMDSLLAFGFWAFVPHLRIFVLGLQLEVGDTGLINFGHVAFMAIGAYTMGLLVTNDVSIWIAIPIALAASAAGGLLLGLPTLRLRADYFAITTIAAGEILRIAILNEQDTTGGPQGLRSASGPWRTPTTTSSTSSPASGSSSTAGFRCWCWSG